MKTTRGQRTRDRLEALKAGTGVYSGPPGKSETHEQQVQRAKHASAVASANAERRRRRTFLRPYAGLTQRQAAMRDAELLEPYVGAKEAWRLAWRFWRGVADHELVERHGPSDEAVAAHLSDVRTWLEGEENR